MQTQTVTTFKLGNSTVVTLPKSLGIDPGTKMKTRKLHKKIIMEPEKENTAKKIALVRKLAGGIRIPASLQKELTPEKLNKRYEKEVYGKLLPRR